MTSFDAVVCGGGPAGATAALTLARAGCRVALIEDTRDTAFRIGEALPPAARPLLRDLGLLPKFLNEPHLPCYGNLSAWGSELVATDFVFDVNGHGWRLDRARFDAFLREAAREAGVEIFAGVRLNREQRDGECWTLFLHAGEVRCRWIVDATGRPSVVARRHGARRVIHDRLICFFARFEPAASGDQDTRTLIEAAPDGWWYTALAPSGERVAVFLTDADLAERGVWLTADGFCAALAQTRYVRETLLGYGYRLSGRPRGQNAGSARLQRPAGDGWIAAGDAAIACDPLSSQGILNAMYTGMKAAQAVHAHLAGDLGAMDGYVDRIEEIHRAYVRNLAMYYGYEKRWRDRMFWSRR